MADCPRRVLVLGDEVHVAVAAARLSGGWLTAADGSVPDVMLLGGANGAVGEQIGLVRDAASRFPAALVVFVAERVAPGSVRRLISAGAAAVLVADELDSALPHVLELVCSGHLVIPRATIQAIRKPLSVRERQVLSMVVLGRSNAAIANALVLSESTVKGHLSSSFAKLGVASRGDAVALLLDPDLGRGLGVLAISPKAERISVAARTSA